MISPTIIIKAVVNLATKLGPVLTKVASKAAIYLANLDLDKVGKVIDIICRVAETLDVLNMDVTPEEIGLKAQVADKKSEEFDSVSDYIEYLNKEVVLDGKEEIDEEESFAAKCVGAGIIKEAVDEKLGSEIKMEFYTYAAEKLLDKDEIKNIIMEFNKQDIDLIDLIEYGGEKLDSEESYKIAQVLREVFKEAGLSNEEISDKIINLKECRIR